MAAVTPGRPAVRADDSPLAPELIGEVRAAQAQLERSILEGKLHDDPLRFPLIALATSLGVLERLFVDGALTLARVVSEAQRPATLSPDNQKELVRSAAREVMLATRLAILDSARAIRRPALIGSACIVLVLAAVCVGGGYWWGHSAAEADIARTDAGLQAAFSNGPEAAQRWLELMRWNDPRKALAQCQGQAVSVQGGRRACGVPLWIEPSPPSR